MYHMGMNDQNANLSKQYPRYAAQPLKAHHVLNTMLPCINDGLREPRHCVIESMLPTKLELCLRGGSGKESPSLLFHLLLMNFDCDIRGSRFLAQ